MPVSLCEEAGGLVLVRGKGVDLVISHGHISKVISHGNRKLPVPTCIEMSSVGLAISSYFATFSLIETVLFFCPETSQSAGAKGFVLEVPAAPCDHAQFSKRCLSLSWGFGPVGLGGCFVLFVH